MCTWVCAWVSMHVPYSFCVVILGQLCGVGSMEWNSGPQTSEANNGLYPVRCLADHHHNSPMGPTLENERTNYHKFSSGFHVAHLCEHTHTIKKWIFWKKIILLINIISLYHGKGTQCFMACNESQPLWCLTRETEISFVGSVEIDLKGGSTVSTRYRSNMW